MTTSWQDLAKQKRDAILAAIPSEWRLDKVPAIEEQVDVTEYVEQYLSEEEIQITQSSADAIAKNVAEGKWTAEVVTRAFCHRAALAHQLVHNVVLFLHELKLMSQATLPTRDLLRCRYCRCEETRFILLRAQEDYWTATWRASQSQGSIPCQRCRDHHGLCGLDWHL